MAEQQQTNPEAVHALAAAVNPIQWGGGGNDLKARMVAEAILADPGPLLEALAQVGVLEVEWASRNKSGGGAICRTRTEAEQDRDDWNADLGGGIDDPPRSPVVAIERRYVTAWTKPKETP